MAKLPQFGSVRDTIMIRGFSPRVRGLASEIEVRDVVSALCFDHLDSTGREITDIGNFQYHRPNISVRLDRQPNPTAGGANLQVQVNNSVLGRISRNSMEGTTIAQVIVPAAIHRTALGCHEHNIRSHLENVVRSAMLSSFESMGSQFKIVEI